MDQIHSFPGIQGVNTILDISGATADPLFISLQSTMPNATIFSNDIDVQLDAHSHLDATSSKFALECKRAHGVINAVISSPPYIVADDIVGVALDIATTFVAMKLPLSFLKLPR